MGRIKLRPGDIFCTMNPMALGWAINAVQRFFDPDDEAKYSHAGIITSVKGDTFETLWTVKFAHLDRYAGQQIIIGRHNGMTAEKYQAAFSEIIKHQGQGYPFHRLLFYLIPPLAKYVHVLNRPVCSELAAKFLMHAGLLKRWAGKNPDYIADMMKRWQWWTVIYEGVLG